MNRTITQDLAFTEGSQARQENKPRSIPAGYVNAPGLRKAWLKGWDSITIPQLEITIKEAVVTTREVRWPDNQPLPETYVRPKPVPCIECRAVRLKSGAQAVLVTHLTSPFAYLWCRGCQARFKMRLA